MGVRAQVNHGRLVVDEPTSLPEGTVVDLVVEDEGDDLDAAEREALDAAISRSWEEAQAGKVRPASELLMEFNKQR